MPISNLHQKIHQLYVDEDFQPHEKTLPFQDPILQHTAENLLDQTDLQAVLDLVHQLQLDGPSLEQPRTQNDLKVCLWLLAKLDPSHSTLVQLAKQEEWPLWFRDTAMLIALKSSNHESHPHRIKEVLFYLLRTQNLKQFTGIVRHFAERQQAYYLPDLMAVGFFLRNLPESDFKSAAGAALNQARGCLGDRRVLRKLIQLQEEPVENPFWDRALQGLPKLIQLLGGLERALKRLQYFPSEMTLEDQLLHISHHDRDGWVRSWARRKAQLLQKTQDPEVLLQGLQDPEWVVRRHASDRLALLPAPPVSALEHLFTSLDTDREIRLWAAYTLLRLGEMVELSLIPDVRAPLPKGISEPMHQDIVRFWVPFFQDYTDVRWLIEGVLLPRNTVDLDEVWSGFPVNWPTLKQKLEEGGFEVLNVASGHEEVGKSSYHEVEYWKRGQSRTRIWKDERGDVEYRVSYRLWLSVVGPYFHEKDPAIGILSDHRGLAQDEYQKWHWELKQHEKSVVQPADWRTMRGLLKEQGWIDVNMEQSQLPVPGLWIRHLGFTGEATLLDYLFHWSD